MKRCDSCKNVVDHICFAPKKYLKSDGITHAPHHIWYIYHIAENAVIKLLHQLKFGNLEFLIANLTNKYSAESLKVQMKYWNNICSKNLKVFVLKCKKIESWTNRHACFTPFKGTTNTPIQFFCNYINLMVFLTLPYLYPNHRFISDKTNCTTCVNWLCKNNHPKLNIWRHPRGLFSGYSTRKMIFRDIYCVLSNFMSFPSLKPWNCTHKQTNKQTHIYALRCTLILSYTIVIMYIYIDYYLL